MRNTRNNQVSILGDVTNEIAFSHEISGEEFYTFKLSVSRMSGQKDVIPVIISERLIDKNKNYIGQTLEIEGQYRSCNKHENDKAHLVLYVFAENIGFCEDDCDHKNSVSLDGYICKNPVYRKTPLGREITDLLIAVNRPCGRSDYIPCITWGRNARYSSELPIGTFIHINGRVQSKEYSKLSDNGQREQTKTAYEVSISDISENNANKVEVT